MNINEAIDILIHGGTINRKDLPKNIKLLVLNLQDMKYNINNCIKQLNKLLEEKNNGMDNR